MAKIIAGCNHCGHLFKIEDLFEGIDVECPKCGEKVIVAKVAELDERGVPIFTKDMDSVLDQIYKKAEEMEQGGSVKQMAEMAETLQIDQETLRKAAEVKGKTAVRKLKAGKTAPAAKPGQPKKTKKKLNIKKIAVVAVIAAVIITVAIAAMLIIEKGKVFEKKAKNIYAHALGKFEAEDYEGCLAELNKFFPKYAQSNVTGRAKDLQTRATTQHAAKTLLDDAKKLYGEEKAGEALAKLDKIIKDYPESKSIREAQKLKRDWSAEKAIKEAKADFERGKTLYDEGKYQEALPILTKVARGGWEFSDTANKLVKKITRYERQAQELFDQGKQKRQGKKFDDAIKLFNQVLADYPKSKVAPDAKQATEDTQKEKERYAQKNFDRHMKAGNQLFKDGKWRQAAGEFNKALNWKDGDRVAEKREIEALEMADRYEDMIKIPEGEFIMGSEDSEPDEKPSSTVSLSAYYISKYPVTNEQYKRFLDDAKNENYPVPYVDAKWAEHYNWDKEARTFPNGKGKHPVVLVSYNDALAYCTWTKKRLPTEAEWEKAARGHRGNKYPWGDVNPNGTHCNFANNERGTTNAGSFKEGASHYGVMDMAGNVWEWCEDFYQKDFYRDPNHGKDPKCIKNTGLHVLKGGCWVNSADILRSSNRYFSEPDKKAATIGFRTAFDE